MFARITTSRRSLIALTSILSGFNANTEAQQQLSLHDAGAASVSTEQTTSSAAALQTDSKTASRLHFSLGADYTTAYFFRGIVQQTEGAIFQPWGELSADIASWDDASLSAQMGIWNSFHSKPGAATTSDNFVENWYEADLYAGLTLAVSDFEFGASYILYTSPSGAFGTVQELDFSISYDDSALWGGDFGLAPSITFAYEIGDNAADGADKGVYFEVGVEPSWDVDLGGIGTVTLSLPVTLGLSVADYFQDPTGKGSTFGFVDVGATASYPLPMPEGFGDWSLAGGVHVLVLGDATESINGGDSSEVIGSVGLTIEF